MTENTNNTEDSIVSKLLIEHPIHEMVKYSEIDLQDKLKDNPVLIIRYKELYYKELSILDKLNDLMDKLIGERYKFYRFEDDKGYTKTEIEKYCIPSDEQIIKMKKIIHKQNTKVRFFETAYKAFEKQQWAMKMFIDVLRGGF
jgi:hypothetical protein